MTTQAQPKTSEAHTTMIELLNQAKATTGSDYRTAMLLGQRQQVINDWRAGRRVAQPADYAMVASLGGTDPITALIQATRLHHKGTTKGDILQFVFPPQNDGICPGDKTG